MVKGLWCTLFTFFVPSTSKCLLNFWFSSISLSARNRIEHFIHSSARVLPQGSNYYFFFFEILNIQDLCIIYQRRVSKFPNIVTCWAKLRWLSNFYLRLPKFQMLFVFVLTGFEALFLLIIQIIFDISCFFVCYIKDLREGFLFMLEFFEAVAYFFHWFLLTHNRLTTVYYSFFSINVDENPPLRNGCQFFWLFKW